LGIVNYRRPARRPVFVALQAPMGLPPLIDWTITSAVAMADNPIGARWQIRGSTVLLPDPSVMDDSRNCRSWICLPRPKPPLPNLQISMTGL
jgi:hypothetical protein